MGETLQKQSDEMIAWLSGSQSILRLRGLRAVSQSVSRGFFWFLRKQSVEMIAWLAGSQSIVMIAWPLSSQSISFAWLPPCLMAVRPFGVAM